MNGIVSASAKYVIVTVIPMNMYVIFAETEIILKRKEKLEW